MTDSHDDDLRRLDRLVGEWTTTSTHPMLPEGTVVHGHASFEWLAGERFLIWRETADHPEFPEALSVIGHTNGLQTHSYDSRGVHRVTETRITDETWEFYLPRAQESETAFAEGSPGFAGRFVGTFADGGNTIEGRFQLSHDDEVTWEDDLQTTYQRVVG